MKKESLQAPEADIESKRKIRTLLILEITVGLGLVLAVIAHINFL